MNRLLRKNHNNALINREGDYPQWVMSDSSVDRYNDIVRASGWKLDKFNGVALVNHDQNLPCGKWLDVHVEGERLLGRFKAAMRGTSARIDELIAMIDEGILNSCSVGFIVHASKPRVNGGTEYTSHELCECSIVSVPANANATMQKAKKIGISDAMIQRILGNPPKNASFSQRAEHARGMLTADAARAKAEATIRRIYAEVDAKFAREARVKNRAQDKLDEEIIACRTVTEVFVTNWRQHEDQKKRIGKIKAQAAERRAIRLAEEFDADVNQGADPTELMRDLIGRASKRD